jgi:hypothetical protein
MTKSIEFTFNSALSGVDTHTGAWSQKAHDELAKKVRSHIMGQPTGDGICGMFIARYGMNVEYIDKATSPENVVGAVNEAIQWAADQEDMFPLRGDKTPEAILDTHIPKPTKNFEVIAELSTNLYALPTTNEETQQLRLKFAKLLVRLDGVCEYSIYLDGAALTVDTTITTVEQTKEHFRNLFATHANQPDSAFLPFNKDKEVAIRWHVKNILK